MKMSGMLLVAVALFTVAACDSGDGVAAQAGEVVDQTAEKLGQVASDAGNAIEDVCEEVKENADAENTDC
jgi:hypothetical protein